MAKVRSPISMRRADAAMDPDALSSVAHQAGERAMTEKSSSSFSAAHKAHIQAGLAHHQAGNKEMGAAHRTAAHTYKAGAAQFAAREAKGGF